MVAAAGGVDANVEIADRAVEIDVRHKEGDVDLLANSGFFRIAERRKDMAECADARHVVGKSGAVLHRGAVLLAGDIHKSAHCLSHNVPAGLLAIRSFLAVHGYGKINELGVYLAELLISEAKPVHDTGAVAFRNDVKVLDHALYKLNSLRILKVHFHGLLAAVEPCSEQADTVIALHTESALGVADDRAFDFYDLCAVVCEHCSRGRACGVLAEVENADAFKQIIHLLPP